MAIGLTPLSLRHPRAEQGAKRRGADPRIHAGTLKRRSGAECSPSRTAKKFEPLGIGLFDQVDLPLACPALGAHLPIEVRVPGLLGLTISRPLNRYRVGSFIGVDGPLELTRIGRQMFIDPIVQKDWNSYDRSSILVRPQPTSFDYAVQIARHYCDLLQIGVVLPSQEVDVVLLSLSC
jgi:hypothetical protein